MRLLDLFCGAGGAAMGYHRAGFTEIVGVDIKPQPRYPFTFVQGDALKPPVRLEDFDAIHASPPCQAHTSMKTMPDAREHPDLVPATRALLAASGLPYAIENVHGAPLIYPVRLCGTAFGLGCDDAELRRHRMFESNVPMLAPPCQHGKRATLGVYGGHLRNRKRRVRTVGVYGEGVRDSVRKRDRGVADFGVEQGREAMGIAWMTLAELCQAIPPAYTEFIGLQLIAAIRQERVA
jgi:DNA (cytosine-5)-methyltransferase 1